MHTLNIDIETYSSVDIKKSGAYRYASVPDFEIMLFGYSLDRAPRQMVDMVCGEPLPDWILMALTDPGCIKKAYNAAFEFNCLQTYLERSGDPRRLVPSQWRDTMLHALYCGLPGSLDAAGKALGLSEDKQKMAVGRSLIRYFCVPCKPTKANGGRTRNMPWHDPEKWELFKTYCMQDVTTEMAVDEKLAAFPVPDFVQKQWETDLVINRRGVAVDMELVNGALSIGAQVKEQLTEEAARISQLSNPNSRNQLLNWVNSQTGGDMQSLTKDVVRKALAAGEYSPEVMRMLEIRQELGKTSTAKYDALESCICPDGRVRGLLQFYGASRTGRWAGRLVQAQNLPRTYVDPIELARKLVKEQRPDALQLIYGSIQDTLSQLIRTAFVPAPGNRLIDADFSAIEARVISWLAGEEWRLEVFRTHGKIYEASASQMFGVPIELIKKGNPEYALRAKGKVAELALGYAGGSGALIAMGALDMGLREEELPDIVQRWRTANSRIRTLWYNVEAAAMNAISGKGRQRIRNRDAEVVFDCFVDSNTGLPCMTIQLPSGRKLHYLDPHIGTNRFGGEAITFRGVDQTTKRWTVTETFGGKLVENIVQAIARDCLAEAIERLEAAGFPIVFHVHDEVVIDIRPYADDETMLQQVVDIMRQEPSWAPGLPLNAAGWVGDFFTKD